MISAKLHGAQAKELFNALDELRRARRSAALDWCPHTGELVLRCTVPEGSTNLADWGKGPTPQLYSGNWVRLLEI